MGGCNQATISVGESVVDGKRERFEQPPCLRLIDMRIRYGRLYFIVYFRSWDLIGGYPVNMGGLQLLKEWCLNYLNGHRQEEGKPLIEDGGIVACSKGLHLYDHYWSLSESYVGGPLDEDGPNGWMGIYAL